MGKWVGEPTQGSSFHRWDEPNMDIYMQVPRGASSLVVGGRKSRDSCKSKRSYSSCKGHSLVSVFSYRRVNPERPKSTPSLLCVCSPASDGRVWSCW